MSIPLVFIITIITGVYADPMSMLCLSLPRDHSNR